MTRRNRRLAIGTVVVLLAGLEVAYRFWWSPMACVSIVNQAGEPIEDLQLECDGQVARVPRIAVGESANVYVTGRGMPTLKVTYRLKGSTLPGFQVSGFHPAALRKEGFKLVIIIRQDEWERYQEDADPSLIGSLAGHARRWLVDSLLSP